MKLFPLLYKKVSAPSKDTEKEDTLVQKYAQALKYYCPLCQRGFDKQAGKKLHDRWKHTTETK